ncbi:hypothetical protein [Rhizobium sp.]|uniref:hypothetical protein n=1 Tax=Rhizobium sp. TaxID=391 RepID=UPI000DDB0C76
MEHTRETSFNVLFGNAEMRRRLQALYEVEEVQSASFDYLLDRINDAEAAKSAEFSQADGLSGAEGSVRSRLRRP